MKIRSGHIAFAIVAIIAAFVTYTVWRAHHQSRSMETLLSTGQIEAALAPSIHVEHMEFDMGLIENKAPTEDKLRLFNEGNAPLRLHNIMSTCACTQGIIPPGQKSIPPGGEGYIIVKVFPEKIPGFHTRKTLSVLSNDPQKPSVDVTVIVKIDPEFDLTPSEADFGNVPKGQTPEITLTLTSLAEEPVEITRIGEFTGGAKEKPPELFTFSFEKRPEAEWPAPGKPEYQITVALTPFLAPGPFEQRFIISTNIQRMHGMICTAKGTIIAPYTVNPGYPAPLLLVKGAVRELPESVAGTLTITSEHPIEILDVQCDPAKLLATLRKGDAPLKTHIDISVKPDAPQGPIQEVVSYTIQSGGTAFQEKINARSMFR